MLVRSTILDLPSIDALSILLWMSSDQNILLSWRRYIAGHVSTWYIKLNLETLKYMSVQKSCMSGYHARQLLRASTGNSTQPKMVETISVDSKCCLHNSSLCWIAYKLLSEGDVPGGITLCWCSKCRLRKHLKPGDKLFTDIPNREPVMTSTLLTVILDPSTWPDIVMISQKERSSLFLAFLQRELPMPDNRKKLTY